MNPFILPLVGPIAISWYGLCIVIGVSLFIYLAYSDIRRSSIITTPHFFDCAAVGILGGLLGGKLLFLLTTTDVLAPIAGWYDIARLTVGGFAILGAIVGAVFGIVCMARLQGVKVLALLDLASAYALVAHGIARIGCFISGCCYGAESYSFPWPVIYTHKLALAPLGIPLVPTQIMMSAASLCGFFICYALYQRRGRKDGVTLAVYLFWESAFRFLIDFWRGDREFLWWGLSAYQIIALALCLVSMVLLYRFSFAAKGRR